MKFIGIDIGKSNFVAAFPTISGYQTKTYPNSTAGIRKFISAISLSEHHCVMEATGNYGTLLLYLLYQSGIAASLVNPKQVKHFAPDDDGCHQNRHQGRLYDRYVRGENEPSCV